MELLISGLLSSYHPVLISCFSKQPVKTTEEILQSIDDVDKETINRVIDKIFNIDKLGLCIVGRDVEEIELIK